MLVLHKEGKGRGASGAAESAGAGTGLGTKGTTKDATSSRVLSPIVTCRPALPQGLAHRNHRIPDFISEAGS